MLRCTYNGQMYTIKELSEMSGVEEYTIRDRLRRGYTVQQAIQVSPMDTSVIEFNNASYYKDWIGMSTTYLYKIYWEWCIVNGYSPSTQVKFIRQILKMYPNLKTVSTRKRDGCCRIIRERLFE